MDKQAPAISGFFGEYRFLSNFWPCAITIVGIPYNSVEAAYQASKSSLIGVRRKFSQLMPKEAKGYGRKIVIMDGWNDMIKISSMELCLRAKFAIPALKRRLISTGNAELIEGNTWGDQFWGQCGGEGRNVMGKLLMMLRDEAIAYDEPPIVNDDPQIPF